MILQDFGFPTKLAVPVIKNNLFLDEAQQFEFADLIL